MEVRGWKLEQKLYTIENVLIYIKKMNAYDPNAKLYIDSNIMYAYAITVFMPGSSKPLRFSHSVRLCISTPQRLDTSTYQHLNVLTHKQINTHD